MKPFLVAGLWLCLMINPAHALSESEIRELFDTAQSSRWTSARLATLGAEAEAGSREAAYGLGVLFRTGKAVRQDAAQALTWLGSAADREHGPAQYQLSQMFLNGEGVAKSPESAWRWLRASCENHYAPALDELAGRYYLGNGVIKSRVAAYALYTVAQQSGGSMAAANNLPVLERKLTEAEGRIANQLATTLMDAPSLTRALDQFLATGKVPE